ncbi:MAG: DUF2177 family protein [Candidatus Omnitrophica bacterium]|nr:DUF2177 family protein [Candidatus Omnitrophota bacterium]
MFFAYILTFLVFFVVDIVWLGFLGKELYYNELSGFLKKDFNWAAAMIFYFIFVAGICFFAVMPGIRASSQLTSLIHGAFFGLVTYATYDLTNLATLEKWPVKISIIDILWGIILSSIVSFAGYHIFRKIGV